MTNLKSADLNVKYNRQTSVSHSFTVYSKIKSKVLTLSHVHPSYSVAHSRQSISFWANVSDGKNLYNGEKQAA